MTLDENLDIYRRFRYNDSKFSLYTGLIGYCNLFIILESRLSVVSSVG